MLFACNYSVLSQTPENFKRQYDEVIASTEYKSYSRYGLAYDAMWAIALGLNTTLTRIRNNDSSGCEDVPGSIVPLEEFDYSNAKMGCLLRQSYHQTSFSGVTVSVMAPCSKHEYRIWPYRGMHVRYRETLCYYYYFVFWTGLYHVQCQWKSHQQYCYNSPEPEIRSVKSTHCTETIHTHSLDCLCQTVDSMETLAHWQWFSVMNLCFVCYCLHLSFAGNVALMMEKIGVVRVAGEASNNTFEYAEGETQATVWPRQWR